jgi:hypothetical protein
MVRRPCLEPHCPNLAAPGQPRCTPCTISHRRARPTTTAQGYGWTWQRHARSAITAYRQTHGDICPGFGTPAHPITPPNHWVCDHDLGPLCQSCNGRKAATVDRARAAALRRSSG